MQRQLECVQAELDHVKECGQQTQDRKATLMGDWLKDQGVIAMLRIKLIAAGIDPDGT